MSIDLSYYNDKYPLNHDSFQNIRGIKHTIGKHSYGIELIKFHFYDPLAAFHIGRFCAIANTELYLGGSKNTNLISTAFFIPKFFSNSLYGEELSEDQLKKISVDNSIYIGNDVWIGNGSTVMPHVIIGNGAVISANAHVVSNVPPYAIYGGNPAKLIRYRFSPETIDLLQELAWWELEDAMINSLSPRLAKTSDSLDDEIKNLILAVKSQPRSNAFVDQQIKIRTISPQ